MENIELKQTTNRYFTFLRRLRAGGRSNMYGAIPYLAAAFGVDREEAFRIVCAWVDGEAEAKAHGEESASAPRQTRAVVRKRKASGRRAA